MSDVLEILNEAVRILEAEKEREDTDYYDNSGSRQKQDV